MVRETYSNMGQQKSKKKIEGQVPFAAPKMLDVGDEAERLYAADAEAALNEFRQDGHPTREDE
jgi:hypothetical protein